MIIHVTQAHIDRAHGILPPGHWDGARTPLALALSEQANYPEDRPHWRTAYSHVWTIGYRAVLPQAAFDEDERWERGETIAPYSFEFDPFTVEAL